MMVSCLQQIEKAKNHEYRSVFKADSGSLCVRFPRVGILGKPLLVPLHCVRRVEPVPIGLYELVSDDDNPAQSGRESIG